MPVALLPICPFVLIEVVKLVRLLTGRMNSVNNGTDSSYLHIYLQLLDIFRYFLVSFGILIFILLCNMKEGIMK